MRYGRDLCLAFVCVSIGISACAERRLPNSYTYVITNACEAVIEDPQEEIIVPQNVAKYVVIKEFIIGIRKNSCNLTRDYAGPYGFFIVNTKTGYVKLGLSRAELRDRMRTLGLDDVNL